ncbi:hypothetical protein AAX27_01230 [Aliarcobacter thereius]|nr:hypothetical protein AAX27_01230 [Aliarcobacter thereius]
MKRLLIISIIPLFAFSKSVYKGTYVCNEKQQVTIDNNNLYIGNSTFNYKQTNNNSDIFINENKKDAAIFFKSPSGNFTLNIWDMNEIINKTMRNPYVGSCSEIR